MKRDLYHWIHRKKLKKKHFINFSGQLTFLGSHEIPSSGMDGHKELKVTKTKISDVTFCAPSVY